MSEEEKLFDKQKFDKEKPEVLEREEELNKLSEETLKNFFAKLNLIKEFKEPAVVMIIYQILRDDLELISEKNKRPFEIGFDDLKDEKTVGIHKKILKEIREKLNKDEKLKKKVIMRMPSLLWLDKSKKSNILFFAQGRDFTKFLNENSKCIQKMLKRYQIKKLWSYKEGSSMLRNMIKDVWNI
ncbi:MAG: hypothetical protein ABH808_03240 [Candidatus Kuenenbacteria bacterium]